MKVICSRKDLYEGVQTAARAVSTRTSLPILEHLLIETDGDSIKITATDFVVGIECSVEAEVSVPGAMTVKARMFTEILSSLPDADVYIESDEDNTVLLQCGNSDYSMLSLAPDEFPQLPETEEQTSIILGTDKVADAIEKTVFAVSKDSARAVLTGVYFDGSSGHLKVASTDTHRLSVCEYPDIEIPVPFTALLPARALTELTRLITQVESVELFVSPNQAKFICGNVILTCRIIEGQYPNYNRVIPEPAPNRLIIPTEHLLQSVRRVEIVAREDEHRTVLSSEESKLAITAQSTTVGSAREEVEVIVEGEDIKMAFNSRYLAEALSVIDTEAVVIETLGDNSPALITAQGKDDFKHVLMPMRINN